MRKSEDPRGRRLWQLLRNYRSVAAAIAVGIALTLTGFHLEQQRARERLVGTLAMIATDEAARIQRSVDIAVEVLDSIGSFFRGSDEVDRDEFRTFVAGAIAKHPEIRALEWVPRISAGARPAFEAELRQVIAGRGIRELDGRGELVRAARRGEYFPIAYVEPLDGNESALGLDVSSRPAATRTLWTAVETGQATASNAFTLVQGGGAVRGIAVYRPIYRNGTVTATPEQRRRQLRGLAVAVLEPRELVLAGVRAFRPTGLDVLLLERVGEQATEVLHFHPSRSRTDPIAVPSVGEFRAGLHHETNIRIPGGEWIMVFRPAPRFYEEHESGQRWLILAAGLTLTGLVGAMLLRRVRYLREVLELARRDGLTGLPNRLQLREHLDQMLARAERQGEQLAVLFLDLDQFKHINDSLGHATGDRLLQEVGRRLAGAVRKEDVIARMGGDEFVMIAEELHHEQDAALLAEKLLRVLASPYRLQERTFYLSASIGISLYPRDAHTADSLVANADAAMYRAKAKGRNTFEFYVHELTTASTERLQLEAELRQALRSGGIAVHYQPQVDLITGRIIGAEALARWRHAEHGDIGPDRFIPLARDAGLIVELGESVLRQACRQARIWLDCGFDLQCMAVNVTGEQIQRGDFAHTVQQVLTDTGLAPRLLELEVTEGFIMWPGEGSIDTLRALSQLGVTLSIDDFGTGYSSLAYLKRLPIDKLKIDRSFVRGLPADEEDAAITRAVVAMAHSLGLRVLAEGVETAAQRDFLAGLGCREAQGFLFGRPVDAREFPPLPAAVRTAN